MPRTSANERSVDQSCLDSVSDSGVRAARFRTRVFSRAVAMLAGGALSVLCWTDSLLAQGDGAAGPDAGAGEGAGGSNVVVTQSFPWLGLFVTLILAGLCLFAVCRSSRRN